MNPERDGRKDISWNQSWTYTFAERPDVSAETHTYFMLWTNTISKPRNLASQRCVATLPRQNHELAASMPTQVEVDAYMNSLEHEFAEEQKRRGQIESPRKAEPIKSSNSSSLWCLLLAAIIGCIYWVMGF